MRQEDMDAYSIVTSPYRLGDTVGRLGVIGPTRMDYGRAVALVESMADVVNRPASDDPTGADSVAPSPASS
jgi:heat-inducible transcriptional repressor